MQLVPAKTEKDWKAASDMLMVTVRRLESIQPLWDVEQVTVDGLKEVYDLSELRFLYLNGVRVGSVFLQEQDPIFWPECRANDSLFFHKLNILPEYTGRGLGEEAVRVICREAAEEWKSWVRLDCDDRPFLHRFYKGLGFSLVDIKQVGRFTVGRYQLAVSHY